MTNKFKRILLLSILPVSIAGSVAAAEPDHDVNEPLYGERWRPQYHFTPAHRWIGDPCGLVYADGKFRAYSWGGAESDDLVHWTEINDNAILGLPGGIAPFTGSVVIDRDNTAGYGNGAYIAAFTSFDEQSKKQSQSIAFSRDGGVTYNYYDLNPVLDIWSTEFRDPTVIRDEETSRWIMLVARALEKKVAFYASTDLKHWEWLSDFGPMGDNEKSWECPDMFRLPVGDEPGKSKWVLLVSVNWAREQYFVGEFDGTRFIPDHPYSEPLYVDAGLDYYASRTFQDYDGDLPAVSTLGWVSTWDYAHHVPTTYGKGVWSLPHELYLTTTPGGLRLCQRPAAVLSGLRGEAWRWDSMLKTGVTPLSRITAMDNTYELVAEIETSVPNTVGFDLCSDGDRKIRLVYDSASESLLLDRTHATATEIPKFSRMAFSKVSPAGGVLNLDIFVDRSVVEVFVNGGETVMTALVFPTDSGTGAEVFALNPGTHINLTAYPMKSIHRK